jgi:predicted TIM-barrel enzyme
MKVTRPKNANYDSLKKILTSLRKIVFCFLDIEAKGVKAWQKKILTAFAENVFSYVDMKAIRVTGTGTGHKRNK